MVREYIEKLLEENNEDLKRYEQQMSDLFVELEASKEILEVLQKEKDADKNIFSPRTADLNLRDKIDDSRKNIDRINQNIEYVRGYIELYSKRKEEFQTLLEEVTKTEALGSIESSAESTEPIEPTESAKPESQADSEETKKFLSDLYRKTEFCLALLNGDRNKCRKELLSIKEMIRMHLHSGE